MEDERRMFEALDATGDVYDTVPYKAVQKAMLALQMVNEEFCDGLYVHRKTLSLTIFVGSQAAFLTAG